MILQPSAAADAPARLLHAATDLTSFMECEVLTALNLRALTDPDLAAQRIALDDSTQLITDKGVEHEKAYLHRLISQGLTVVDIAAAAGPALADRVQATQQAMAQGAQVIYQAALTGDDLVGHADFLVRVDTPSALGGWSYEVEDTKLARSAKGKFLVQLSFYSHLLEPLQGLAPRQMHVVLGDGKKVSFACEDTRHYVQSLLQRYRACIAQLQAPSSSTPAAYPLPCDHCSMCPWRNRCAAQRVADDHLCQVAGVRKDQIVKLEQAGIRTMAQLGALAPTASVPQLNPQTRHKLVQQARLQTQGKATGQLHFELIDHPIGSLRGFERLPQPHPGDIFFDMEGDPLHDQGLEYLFGLWFEQNGAWTFKAFWAHDRAQEKQAFEDCIDFIMQRRAQHPGLHVYHYASYEESAFKRLATSHGTREAALDELLRGKVLVDLYRVVREALCISQPSYSIKYVEHFYRGQRGGDVTNAGASIVSYERWRESQDPQLLQDIQNYNRDDVQSTQQLRDWLLTLRPSDLPWRTAQSNPGVAAVLAKSEKRQQAEERFALYQQRLMQALPKDVAAWSTDDHILALTAQMLGFHGRANKPQWWSIFSKADLSLDELLEDPECLAGLTLDPAVPPMRVGSKTRYTFVVPPQDSKLGDGDDCTLTHSASEIKGIAWDDAAGRLSIEVSAQQEPLPEVLSLGPQRPINTIKLEDALYAFADGLLNGQAAHSAIAQLLRRDPPRVQGLTPGQPLIAQGQDTVQGCVYAALNLQQSYLYVQGPPGAGKTYVGSRMIAALLAAGKRVGVMSNSHKAIHHLMQGAIAVASEQGVAVHAVKKASEQSRDSYFQAEGARVSNITDPDKVARAGGNLIGGTAFLFCRHPNLVDVLFVDEAGQVALANLVASSVAAPNLVLLGDQMQLSQPTQGAHPGRSGESALDYLLDGAATIAPHKGIFLATTWRMHPQVCEFISQAVYEGRLHPEPHNARRTLVLSPGAHPSLRPSGIVHVPIAHTGCSLKSEAEAQFIAQVYQSALQQQYTDTQGRSHPLTTDHILVVAPYNLQVKLLKRLLPAGARVGTVDKFQGQEAELVIVSMTTSSEQDLPRHLGFLYSKNRLNVAISRAKCMAIVLANSALLAIKCHQPQDMQLVNTLCAMAEYSSSQERA